MIKTGKNHVAHPLSFADISIFDQKLEISVVLGSKEKKNSIFIQNFWLVWLLLNFWTLF